MEHTNRVEFEYADLDDAFPAIAPGIAPFGSRVLVQVRVPKRKTKGGILLLDETRETEHYNTQIAKVVAAGPLAFHNRNTMEPWPEGSWCRVGDFVRTPRYGGDRWSVFRDALDTDGKPMRDAAGNALKDEIVFVIFNDLDLIGKVTGDPTAIRAYL